MFDEFNKDEKDPKFFIAGIIVFLIAAFVLVSFVLPQGFLTNIFSY